MKRYQMHSNHTKSTLRDIQAERILITFFNNNAVWRAHKLPHLVTPSRAAKKRLEMYGRI